MVFPILGLGSMLNRRTISPSKRIDQTTIDKQKRLAVDPDADTASRNSGDRRPHDRGSLIEHDSN